MIAVMSSSKVLLLISLFSDYTKIFNMANIVFTPTCMEQDDIECAANVLVELKQDSFNNDISATDNCSVSPLPPLNMALVPATQDSGWRRMFENTKFELRIIRDIVRNVLCSSAKAADFPSIEKTFQHMQTMHSCGYVVAQQAITTVCNGLRQLLEHAFDKNLDGHHRRNAIEVTMFSKAVIIINRYESSAWEYHARHYSSFSVEQEMDKFSSMMHDIQPDIETLLPSQHSRVLNVVTNNILCIHETGLRAKHALQHVMQVLHDI